MIAELLASSPADDFYDAKMKVLSEEIKRSAPTRVVFAQARDGGLDMERWPTAFSRARSSC